MCSHRWRLVHYAFFFIYLLISLTLGLPTTKSHNTVAEISNGPSSLQETPKPIATSTVYLIRHGEKPEKIDGKDQIGLSPDGEKRAQGLRNVFGRNSDYNIGLILAQKPKSGGEQARPWLTVEPLSHDLPNVVIDLQAQRDQTDLVAKTVKGYKGLGNVLICWEHGRLQDIVKALGVQNPQPYPSDRFDLIWTVESPYDKINNVTSEMILPTDKQPN